MERTKETVYGEDQDTGPVLGAAWWGVGRGQNFL